MLKNLQDVPMKHRMSADSAEKNGKQYKYFLLRKERVKKMIRNVSQYVLLIGNENNKFIDNDACSSAPDRHKNGDRHQTYGIADILAGL